jgi:hypothetical protein
MADCTEICEAMGLKRVQPRFTSPGPCSDTVIDIEERFYSFYREIPSDQGELFLLEVLTVDELILILGMHRVSYQFEFSLVDGQLLSDSEIGRTIEYFFEQYKFVLQRSFLEITEHDWELRIKDRSGETRRVSELCIDGVPERSRQRLFRFQSPEEDEYNQHTIDYLDSVDPAWREHARPFEGTWIT